MITWWCHIVPQSPKYLATFVPFQFSPKASTQSPAHQTVYQAGLLEGTFALMATETTQSGASNCAEGLCLLCEGRFSPGELYRMFFWSRQGKQQQLCTSSCGGLYLCVCMSARVRICVCVCVCVLVISASLYLHVRLWMCVCMCVCVCVCVCVCAVGLELTEQATLKAQPR